MPADHASRAGHFPGKPVVPGVVLLDEVLGLLSQGVGDAAGFGGVRFLRPVRFGQEVDVLFGGEAFACRVDGVEVVRGTVSLRPGA